MKEESKTQSTWKHMFLFTKDGKLQSTDLMSSVFLGLGILFLHFIISNRLTILFESLFPALSRSGKNLLGILVPAILCALAAVLLFRLIRKKNIVLMSYGFALLLGIVVLVIILFEFDAETISLMTPAYIGIFIIPSAAGTVTVTLLYRKWLQSHPDPLKEEQPEPEPEPEEEENIPESDEPDYSGWKQFR